MVIIAESGATKTAWRAVSEDGAVSSVQTDGLSPTCLDQDRTNDIVRQAIPELNPQGKMIQSIHFYGAGLVSSEAAAPLIEAIARWCPFAEVEFHSDILAAARALWGNGSGVVAIMGTGSNSCLYENGEIVRNIRPGGFILGDEGGAVSLGRAFLADYIKGLVPEEISQEFDREFGLDYSSIVRKVYKEQAASAFMASLAPFVTQRLSHPYMSKLTEDCLEGFIVRALSRYTDSAKDKEAAQKVGVVGSFGIACRDMLLNIGKRHGLEFVKFIKSPIEELTRYHRYGI